MKGSKRTGNAKRHPCKSAVKSSHLLPISPQPRNPWEHRPHPNLKIISSKSHFLLISRQVIISNEQPRNQRPCKAQFAEFHTYDSCQNSITKSGVSCSRHASAPTLTLLPKNQIGFLTGLYESQVSRFRGGELEGVFADLPDGYGYGIGQEIRAGESGTTKPCEKERVGDAGVG